MSASNSVTRRYALVIERERDRERDTQGERDRERQRERENKTWLFGGKRRNYKGLSGNLASVICMSSVY